jgi:hypothetical protein
VIVRVTCPECQTVGTVEVDLVSDRVGATCPCGEVVLIESNFGAVTVDGARVTTVVA